MQSTSLNVYKTKELSDQNLFLEEGKTFYFCSFCNEYHTQNLTDHSHSYPYHVPTPNCHPSFKEPLPWYDKLVHFSDRGIWVEEHSLDSQSNKPLVLCDYQAESHYTRLSSLADEGLPFNPLCFYRLGSVHHLDMIVHALKHANLADLIAAHDRINTDPDPIPGRLFNFTYKYETKLLWRVTDLMENLEISEDLFDKDLNFNFNNKNF